MTNQQAHKEGEFLRVIAPDTSRDDVSLLYAVLYRSAQDFAQIRKLDWSWGMTCNTLRLDSFRNILLTRTFLTDKESTFRTANLIDI